MQFLEDDKVKMKAYFGRPPVGPLAASMFWKAAMALRGPVRPTGRRTCSTSKLNCAQRFSKAEYILDKLALVYTCCMC